MKLRLPHIAPLAALAAFALNAADAPKVGDPAPAVDAKDQDGNAWKLADHAGNKVVLLYFYPKDDTPGCTKQACGWRDRMGTLQGDNVLVVGVSRDDAESHRRFREKFKINFPLLVDTDGKLTEAYGAAMEGRPMSRRVSFLINRDGKITHITDNRDAQVHLDEMEAALAKLKS